MALLALTSGVLVATAFHTAQTDAEQIDYRVDAQVAGCDTAEDHRVSQFDELSPEAQEVFLSTLQSNGAYTTTTNPEQFDISSDSDYENYIVYESDCYSLVGYGAGLGSGMPTFVLLLFGVPVTLVLAVLAITSYQYIPSESERS
ncbi:hypothetical protein C464_12455 [Halorubrum coriense DSM 10284]|uniref:DUF7979 domain-containing protein n=1 Tax=Halorubrum coriense DSM 10284 TaxID=1227466 RepID=M0EEH9_9EURY|nr:hypothetical protein C464_12455 [Halorubrum coriense DSM 10284]